MKKVIATMVENIKNNIVRDMRDLDSTKGYETLKMVLAAYNSYQEQERDGVDYIFNINDQDDLKCCVEGGLTAQEICGLWLKSQSSHREYFYFGCNYEKPLQIATLAELRTTLVMWLDNVLPCVLAYPHLDSEYAALYERYVTPMVEDSGLPLSDIDALAQLRAKLEAMGC